VGNNSEGPAVQPDADAFRVEEDQIDAPDLRIANAIENRKRDPPWSSSRILPECHKGDTWVPYCLRRSPKEKRKSKLAYEKVDKGPSVGWKFPGQNSMDLPSFNAKASLKKLLKSPIAKSEKVKTLLQEELIGTCFKSNWFYEDTHHCMRRHGMILLITKAIPLRLVLAVTQQLLYVPNDFTDAFAVKLRSLLKRGEINI
jgi:hypothetical protein